MTFLSFIAEAAERRCSALLLLFSVAFIMHADIKRLCLSHLHTTPVDVPCNTSVTEIEFTENSSILLQFNQIEHLPDHMVTR